MKSNPKTLRLLSALPKQPIGEQLLSECSHRSQALQPKCLNDMLVKLVCCTATAVLTSCGPSPSNVVTHPKSVVKVHPKSLADDQPFRQLPWGDTYNLLSRMGMVGLYLQELRREGVLSSSNLRQIQERNKAWFQEREPREQAAALVEAKYHIHAAVKDKGKSGSRASLDWELAQPKLFHSHDYIGYTTFETEEKLIPWSRGSPKARLFDDLTAYERQATEDAWANVRGMDLRVFGLFGPDRKYSGGDLAWANFTIWKGPSPVLGGIFLCREDFGPDPQGLWADLETNLDHANFTFADLGEANLSGAWLQSAIVLGAMFDRAALKSTAFWGADLRWSRFVDCDLSGAEFWGADLAGVEYEPLTGKLPSIKSFYTAKNVDQMHWEVNPAALGELREAFKTAGLRDLERATTCAIKRSEQRHELGGPLGAQFQGFFSMVLFDWTSAYGYKPWRPLEMLLLLVLVFFFPYLFAFVCPRYSTILVIPPDAIRANDSFLGKTISIVRIAMYFSLLSAFRIGFRDANVGDWIERLQTREYSLRATGWVRAVAGVQSLISLYLFALWILVMFGRPFE